MDAPLRIALIGAGNMGRQHYHRLQRIAGARLCAVADPQGQAFAADAGVPWFGDHRRLLEEARPQAAIVANRTTCMSPPPSTASPPGCRCCWKNRSACSSTK